MLKKVDIRPKMAAKWPLTKLIKLVARAYENDVLKGEEKVQYEQVIKEYSKKFTGDFSRHQHKFLKKVLEDMLLIRLAELRNNPILKSDDYNEIQLEVKRLLVTNQSELYVSLAMYWCEFEQLRSASYDSYAREEYSDSSSDSSDDDSDNDDSNDGREEANVAVRVFSETINRADRFSLLSREEIELAGIIHNILEFDLKRIKWVKDVGDIANKMKLELEESMKNRLKSESEKPSSEKIDEVSASSFSSSSDEDDDDNEDKSQHRKEAPISTEESSKREPKSHQRSLAIQTTNGETQLGERSKEEETNRNSMTLRRSIRSRSSLMTNSPLPKLNVHVGQNISPLPVPNPIPEPTQIIIEFVDEDTTQQQDKEPIKQNDVELKQTEEVNIVEEKKTTEEQPTRMATRRSVLSIPSTSSSNQPAPINTSEANTKRRSDIIPKSVTFVTPPSKHKRQSLPPSKKVISKSVTFAEPKEPTPTRPKRESLRPRASLAPEPKPIRQSPIISPKPPVDECLKEPDQSTSNTATNSTSQMKLRPKRPSINLRMNDYVFDLPASLKANFHTIPTSSSIPNQSQPQPQPQKQTQDIIELVNDELMELITDEPMEVDDNNNKIVNIAPVKVKTTSEISVQTDEIQPEPEPEPEPEQKPVEPVAYPFSSSSRGHNWGLTPIYSIKKGETFEKHDIGEVYIELLRKRRLRKLGLLRPKQKPKRLQQQQQPKQENTTTPNKTAEKTENPEKKVVIVEPEPKSLKTTKTPVKVEKKYPNYKPFIDKTETPVTRELLTFILEKFADHKHSTILSEVKPDDKIKHLIDLTQLRRRIRSEEINTIGKFHHEVMFMFTNFLMLIDSTNPTRNMVREMLNYYLTEVVPMFEMVNRVDESEPQSTAPQTQKTTRRSLLRKA